MAPRHLSSVFIQQTFEASQGPGTVLGADGGAKEISGGGSCTGRSRAAHSFVFSVQAFELYTLLGAADTANRKGL